MIKLPRFFQNVLLLAASLFLLYLFLEFVLFRTQFHHLPLKHHWHLGPAVRTLAAPTKQGALPKDYILLVGDSYAAGVGEGLHAVNPNKNERYGSQKYLYEMTGRDVITFGKTGHGSLSGIAGKPIADFLYIKKLFGEKIQKPKDILVYFYEGNDLNDNLRELHFRFTGPYERDRILDPDHFSLFLREVIIRKTQENYGLFDFEWYDHLIFLKFCYRLIKSAINYEPKKEKPKKKFLESANRVEISGEVVTIPGRLQAPVLEATDEELEIAIFAFKQSLIQLKEFFIGSKIHVIYIPAILSSYRLVGESVSTQPYFERGSRYPREAVYERSDLINMKIENIAREVNVSFLDLRSAIREAASKELIHGPGDWKHFNRQGYRAMAEAITKHMDMK